MLHFLERPLRCIGVNLCRRIGQEDRDIVVSHQVSCGHEAVARVIAHAADQGDPFTGSDLAHDRLGRCLAGVLHQRVYGNSQVLGVDVEHPHLQKGEHNSEYNAPGVKILA